MEINANNYELCKAIDFIVREKMTASAMIDEILEKQIKDLSAELQKLNDRLKKIEEQGQH